MTNVNTNDIENDNVAHYLIPSTHIVCAAHCISGRQKGWFQVE